MTPSIIWPSALPAAQRSGRNSEIVSPTVTTQFASGRNRVRRAFTAVPVYQDVEWKMTRDKAVRFEAWFKNTIKDGSEWFLMELDLPQGRGPWAFQFMGPYRGPLLLGSSTGLWQYTARLQQWVRPEDGRPQRYRITTGGIIRVTTDYVERIVRY